MRDEKGAVSWLANQERSCVGRDCLGNRAACESGPEKSRHIIQTVVEPVLEGEEQGIRGLVACIFDKSGREPRGIGGGEPLAFCPCVSPFGTSP